MIEMTPKLCQLAKAGDPETIAGALMEAKLDGHRMVAFVGQNGVTMYARSGVDKSGKLPAIERWLWDNVPAGTILDGEVIDPRKDGGDWAGVQTILGAGSKQSTTLVFVVFDVLQLLGEDVRGYPLSARRMMLEQLYHTHDDTEPVRLIEQIAYTPEAVAGLIAAGWEGAIVKDPNGKYRSGSRDWVKIKATETVDVVVMGATAGKGKFTGLIGALVFGQYVRQDRLDSTGGVVYVDELVERGQCSGMTDAERSHFTWERDEGSGLRGLVIEVQHMGVMPSGGWRHPQFKRLRTDKRAEECVA